MSKKLSGNFVAISDIGKVRLENEDEARASCNAVGDVLLLVCDGMGGGKKGGYAAKECIELIEKEFLSHPHHLYSMKKSLIVSAIKKANQSLFKAGQEDENFKGMGTTLIAALICKNSLTIFNVGDSRCYRLQEGKLKQLSEDQSYVDYLKRTGQIEEKDIPAHPGRHIITNSMGIYPSLSIDIKKFDYNGELVFLCSDGLYNNVSFGDLETLVSTDENVSQKANSLIYQANLNGGSDNIAISIWESDHD